MSTVIVRPVTPNVIVQRVGMPGPPGPAGQSGQGYTNRGTWAPSTAYNVNDVVQYAPAGKVQSYVCNTAHSSSASFLSDSYWTLWAQAGADGAGADAGTYLAITNDLSDLHDASAARSNLGLGSAATHAATDFDSAGAAAAVQNASLQKSSNLSDLANVPTARNNLGLGTAALVSSTVGGDLSGTLPNLTVAKVNGVAVTGTPSSGQTLVASSSTAASWGNLTITGQYIGSASTFASLPTTDAAGQAASNGDWAFLSADVVGTGSATNPQYPRGAYVYNGSSYSLAISVGADFVIGTSAGTVAAGDDSRITGAAQKSANLSDLASASTARSNLGLGTAAVAALSSLLQGANNLSDVASAATARTNLGLGSAATQSTSAFDAAGAAATETARATAAEAALRTKQAQEWLTTQREGPLQTWHAALANRFSTRANLVVLGDSITEGEGASAITNRFVARLRDNLRAQYPVGAVNGGVGFMGAVDTGEDTFTWPATSTGTGLNNNQDYGAKRLALTVSASGDKVTWTVTGTSIDIMYAKAPWTGVFYYKIDGGSVTTVNTVAGAVADGQLVRVSLGASGTHTVEIGWSSGEFSYIDGIVVYDGDESAGITVHDAGHFGWTTANWAQSNNASNYWPSAIAALNPSAIVIELGTNDLTNSISASQTKTNLTSLIGYLRAAMSAPYPSIVLMPVWVRSTYDVQWPAYVQAMYDIAATDSQVVVCDLSARMPSATTNPLSTYSDTVHPNDKGHSMVADILAGFLRPGV